jgi:6-oxo-cyclohex-1-ene-carbonyl-CoA hydrolase
VYGEFKTGDAFKQAKEELKNLQTDWAKLDEYIDYMAWTLSNTTVLCLMNTIEDVRARKKYFWDNLKSTQIYWLAANMNTEAYLGFNAFNTSKMTGSRDIDFMSYRRLLAEGKNYDEIAEAVMPKPQK